MTSCTQGIWLWVNTSQHVCSMSRTFIYWYVIVVTIHVEVVGEEGVGVWWGDERLCHEGRLYSVEEVEREEGSGLGRVWLSTSGVHCWAIWGEWESCGTNEGHQWEHRKTYEQEQGHLYAYPPDK